MLGTKLGELEVDPTGGDPMARFQELMGDPDVVLGAVRSSRQQELLPGSTPSSASSPATSTASWTRSARGPRGLLPADHRGPPPAPGRGVGPGSRSSSACSASELTPGHYERGAAFIAGVVDRAGRSALEQLWASAEALPTPNELDAPRLWLARLDIPVTDAGDLDELASDIPDDLGDLGDFGGQP